MKSVDIIFFLVLALAASAYCEPEKMPELTKIVRPYTPEFIDLGHITTADSATFAEPPSRTVLNSQTTPIEVVPRCGIDSMTILVRHSSTKIDTLAHLHQPPWRTEWMYAGLPDQDQIHLQLGYTIYQPTGKIITSPSLPHQWVIDRRPAVSGKKYRCRQVIKPDTIIVDGNTGDWNKMQRAPVGASGTFALCWTSATVLTPATLYFLAEIRQKNSTPTDLVELHLDPYRIRTPLSSEKHRSILFAPRGRSYVFVAESTDTRGYQQSDSIAALVNEHVKWCAMVNDSGYVVEAAIPFYTLSELKYPPLRFGMDVTVRSNGTPVHFAGWVNENEFARYNPTEWGVAVLQQSTYPLNIALMTVAFIVVALAGFVLFVSIKNSAVSHRLNHMEKTGDSMELRRIKQCAADRLGDDSLSIDTLAIATGLPAATVSTVIRDELDSSFDQFISFARVEAAKQLLNDITLPFETISRTCGFKSVDEMTERFKTFLRTSPEEFRRRLLEATEEDEPRQRHSLPSR